MASSSSTTDSVPSTRAKLAWLALIVLVHYWCLFDGLAAIGLTGPDEPRFAAIAREMAATGDWVTPRLHGQPWFEKPILYYWAAAVQYKLWGDTEIAARLPSALAATAASLAIGWLALRLYGWSAAQIVLLLFPTTVAAIGFARAATTDMLFSASLALALVAAVRMVTPVGMRAADDATIYDGAKPPPRSRALTELLWRAGFGAALGLAALAKGPAALILAGGSAGLWMLATRRWRDAFALANPAAILMFLLVALPWYVLCALRNPEFVGVFIVSHNFQRFLTPVFQHEQPFWFFGPILLLALVPWTPLLVAAARDGIALLRSNRWVHSPSFFIACWVIFPVLFFSASKSKLPGYVLPAIPPLALLLARSLSKGIAQRDPLTRWLLVATGVVLLILGVAAALPSLAAARLPGVAPYAFLLLAILLAAGGLCTTTLAILRMGTPGVAFVALAIAIAAGVLTRSVLPQMDSEVSPRAVARLISPCALDQKCSASVYKLHRAWHYGLNYYLGQELPVWSQQNDTKYVISTTEGFETLHRQGVQLTGMHEQATPRAMVYYRNE